MSAVEQDLVTIEQDLALARTANAWLKRAAPLLMSSQWLGERVDQATILGVFDVDLRKSIGGPITDVGRFEAAPSYAHQALGWFDLVDAIMLTLAELQFLRGEIAARLSKHRGDGETLEQCTKLVELLDHGIANMAARRVEAIEERAVWLESNEVPS